MRIVVLGTRGFPKVQGGVEAHCENLYPLLAAKGCEVIVFTRPPYVDINLCEYKGVKLVPLSCPKNKFLEAFAHTFKGVFAAKKYNPDILHIHAVGPSLCVPLARLLGYKVVMTHHGPDYQRKKWSKLAKIAIKIGEISGCVFANKIIAISKSIAEDIQKKYGRTAVTIPNGVTKPEILDSDEALKKYGLEKNKYILAVGRFVPEKGFGDLIEAFKTLINTNKNWKLVIVGDADHEDKYSLDLKSKARVDPNIILTGFLTGLPLQELYSHAGLFVLPSYYEGLPIVLLEAMSYGLSCIATDIPANRNIALAQERFFKPADINTLVEKLKKFIAIPLSDIESKMQRDMIAENYDWENIAFRTFELYKREHDLN